MYNAQLEIETISIPKLDLRTGRRSMVEERKTKSVRYSMRFSQARILERRSSQERRKLHSRSRFVDVNFFEEMALNTNMFQLRRILASDRADSQDIKQSSATQNTQVSMPIYIFARSGTLMRMYHIRNKKSRRHIFVRFFSQLGRQCRLKSANG